MSELNADEMIVQALGLNPDEDPDDLVWVRLMPHYFVPLTQTEVRSYICVEINIPENRSRYGSETSPIFSKPTIIFHVITHQEDMRLDMVGESGTRMDYLAELIEEKYEGRMDFGTGVLRLKLDVAGFVNNIYRYRQLVFETTDITGVCG